jgi:hypothetical protein
MFGVEVRPVGEESFYVCLFLVEAMSDVFCFVPFAKKFRSVGGNVMGINYALPLFFEYVQ